MNRDLLILLLLLSCHALPASAQNEDELTSFEMERDVWQALGEEAREAQGQVRNHPDAEIIPTGWVDDFDYTSNLQAYLAARHTQAKDAGKTLHVYLYADWLEPCRGFRKTAAKKDYAELFAPHHIIMVDYGYFAKTVGTKIRNLPVLIQVHENGVLGPENVHPLSRRAEHPAKAFHRLKNYLQAER